MFVDKVVLFLLRMQSLARERERETRTLNILLHLASVKKNGLEGMKGGGGRRRSGVASFAGMGGG